MFEKVAKQLNIKTALTPRKDFSSAENETALLQRYGIIIMLWENKKEINELQFLVKKIRNSISHFRYEIHKNNVLMTDCNKGKQNFRISMKASNLLNLTVEFVTVMNDFLMEEKLIDNNL